MNEDEYNKKMKDFFDNLFNNFQNMFFGDSSNRESFENIFEQFNQDFLNELQNNWGSFTNDDLFSNFQYFMSNFGNNSRKGSTIQVGDGDNKKTEDTPLYDIIENENSFSIIIDLRGKNFGELDSSINDNNLEIIAGKKRILEIKIPSKAKEMIKEKKLNNGIYTIDIEKKE
ncbi:MAG: hypothetical protein ACTSUV_07150 [Candidatus Ranarchaeia archaeon]